jgi:hypothetical protein
MLIGYIRVSKHDGSQTLAPQRDALLAAGVDAARVYEDLAREVTMIGPIIGLSQSLAAGQYAGGMEARPAGPQS